MSDPTSDLSGARAVADAVLYEGYALYPYRASSSKNQVRFQWGVLMPADAVADDPSERLDARADLVVEGRSASLDLVVRFLQVQPRTVEDPDGARVASLDVDDARHVPWDEAVEQEVAVTVPLAEEGRHPHTVDVDGGRSVEELVDRAGVIRGRLVRTRQPVRVGVEVTVQRPVSPYGVTLVTVRVRNLTEAPARPELDRPTRLRRSLVAVHVLARVEGGAFVSQLDPPEWARGFVDACHHDGMFPVLLGQPGEHRVVLASPIILYDHPQLAPESESSFFDGLEVDELLSLRTMTLSEDEKREMRGTDPRTAALLEQVDAMPPDLWDRLHGTIRYVDSMTGSARAPGHGAVASDRAAGPTTGPTTGQADPARTGGPVEPGVPWWDPGADASVDPDTDQIDVQGVPVSRGSRVILRPGARRADAYDMFLAGRGATVAAVFHDVDRGRHLAVTLDEDPGADLKEAHGRYLYFAPDEVEPVPATTGGGP